MLFKCKERKIELVQYTYYTLYIDIHTTHIYISKKLLLASISLYLLGLWFFRNQLYSIGLCEHKLYIEQSYWGKLSKYRFGIWWAQPEHVHKTFCMWDCKQNIEIEELFSMFKILFSEDKVKGGNKPCLYYDKIIDNTVHIHTYNICLIWMKRNSQTNKKYINRVFNFFYVNWKIDFYAKKHKVKIATNYRSNSQ